MRINLDLTLVLATDGNIFKQIAADPKKAYEVGIKHPAKYVDVVANLSLMQQAANLASADSLLGMEGNDVRKMEWVKGTADLGVNSTTGLHDLSNERPLLEMMPFTIPLPFTLQQFVLVISP